MSAGLAQYDFSIGDRQFTWVLSRVRFSEAATAAQLANANLLAIKSASDLSDIQLAISTALNGNVFKSFLGTQADTGSYVWLGASDVVSEGSWVWQDDQTSLDYSNWSSAANHSSASPGAELDFAGMNVVAPVSGSNTNLGEWVDFNSSDEMTYIIEIIPNANGVPDVIGTVVSRGGGLLSGVSVTADTSSPTDQLTTTSSSSGKFAIEFVNGANATITADMTHSNSSPTAAITELDVLEALRLSLGLTKTDGSNIAFDYVAADFNKNGKVTTKDALDILNYFHGTGDLEAEWVFVESNGDYSGISKSNVSYTEGATTTNMSNDFVLNMTGVLLGDVDDTYTGYLDIV